MMKQETIGVGQTAGLFFTYLTGSAMIVIPGPLITMAMNAAWLSMLISLVIGLALLMVMMYLYSLYPGMSFVGISRKTIGKWPTAAMVFLMLTMAFHMASGILVDVAAFMNSMMLPETPGYIFMGMLFLLAALLLKGGIESIARMFSILTVFIIIFWAIVLILLLPDYHPEYLRPIFPQGIKPMLLGSYLTIGFPFGEAVLFMVLLPFAHTRHPKTLKRALVWAMLVSGAIGITSTICTIMVLGPVAAEKKYSLYVLAQIIEIGDFIERMEAIVGMAMIAGSLMKATITLFAILTMLTELFSLPSCRLLINPLCMIAFLMGLTLTPFITEWEEFVFVVHPLWVGVVFILPLLILAAVAGWKNRPGNAHP